MGYAIVNRSAWLGFDFLGVAGEEMAGRVAVLLVALPLIGRRGAILASGILFAGKHLGNLGATWYLVLAAAAVRARTINGICRITDSLVLVVDRLSYGLNWASARSLAAGSGYLFNGRIIDFSPQVSFGSRATQLVLKAASLRTSPCWSPCCC
ncbi:MAG: hypothetical protein M3Y22_14650 [Pseudomonadota bacterium]|nr:hypothetical protein [Pseudomonadota bacterium]